MQLLAGVALSLEGETLAATLARHEGVRVLGVHGGLRTPASTGRPVLEGRDYLILSPSRVPPAPRVLGVDQGTRRAVAIGLPAPDDSLPVVIPPGSLAPLEPGPTVEDGRVVIRSHEERTVAPGVTVILEVTRPLPRGVTASTWDPISRTWQTTSAKP